MSNSQRISICLTVFTLVSTSAVYAASNQNLGNSLKRQSQQGQGVEHMQNQGTLEKVREKIQERLQNRCEEIQHRVANRVNTFEQNREQHMTKYQNFQDRFTTTLVTLKEKGYDTSKLETDFETLKGLIQTFTQDYQSFIGDLQATQEVTCGNSEGAYTKSLENARGALQKVREDVSAIRNFHRNTIKADILELKEQK